MHSSKNMQCRLCLANVNKMHNFVQNPKTTDYDLSIPESIETFFEIKISVEDNYSKHVCSNCLTIIHFIHLQKNTFRNCQDLLTPLEEETRMDDPVPKITEESKSHHKVLVPLEFFSKKIPTVAISSRERNLVDYFLLKDEFTQEISMERVEYENSSGKKDYPQKCYVARDLVREQLQSTENAEWQNERGKAESEDLSFISMQLSVFVCYLCNQVFEKKCDLRKHVKKHILS